MLSELHQTNIKEVRNQICDDRRTGAALRQRILKAGNLRDYRGNLFVQFKTVVVDKESPDAPKIEG